MKNTATQLTIGAFATLAAIGGIAVLRAAGLSGGAAWAVGFGLAWGFVFVGLRRDWRFVAVGFCVSAVVLYILGLTTGLVPLP